MQLTTNTEVLTPSARTEATAVVASLATYLKNADDLTTEEVEENAM